MNIKLSNYYGASNQRLAKQRQCFSVYIKSFGYCDIKQ